MDYFGRQAIQTEFGGSLIIQMLTTSALLLHHPNSQFLPFMSRIIVLCHLHGQLSGGVKTEVKMVHILYFKALCRNYKNTSEPGMVFHTL